MHIQAVSDHLGVEVVERPPRVREVAGSGGRGFDHRLGQTKYSKSDSNGCLPWLLGLRGKRHDILAGVGINGLVVLVTYPGNVGI